MSREAPPDLSTGTGTGQPHDPAQGGPKPPEEPHSPMWLMLPLVALALPWVYRVVQLESVNQALRVRFERDILEPIWMASSVGAAIALVAFMQLRRRGRTIWVVMDLVAGSLPWVVSLAAQSVTGISSNGARYRAADNLIYGIPSPYSAVLQGAIMGEARGLGALMSASLWWAAACGMLVQSGRGPRAAEGMRGAGLVVVCLPAWALAYLFVGSGSQLAWVAALWLSACTAYIGLRSSSAQRPMAAAGMVLASMVAVALTTTATCEGLERSLVTMGQDRTATYTMLGALLDASWAAPFALLLAAALVAGWLFDRRGVASGVALAVACLGMTVLDRAGTQQAWERLVPEPWPPWDGVRVQPLPLQSERVVQERRRPPMTLILSAGALQSSEGQVLAPLSEREAVISVLASAEQAAWVAPDGTAIGERLAIAPAREDAYYPPPLCSGKVISLLIDRSVGMRDLRLFVEAAVRAEVSEIDLVGPAAPDAAELLRRASALAQDAGAAPAPGDPHARLDALLDTPLPPASGFPPADALRFDVRTATVRTPTRCNIALLGEDEGLVPNPSASPNDLGSPEDPESPEDPGDLGDFLEEPLGEQFNEMVEARAYLPPEPRALWLDPAADIVGVLLRSSAEADSQTQLIWVLDAPAP